MSIKAHLINSTLAQYTDAELSFVLSNLFAVGVFGDPTTGTLGCAVTAQGSPNMTVAVASGKAIVSLTKSGVTWNVVMENSASVNVTISNNSSGINRVDAIIVRIDKDAEPNTLKTNIATIEVVNGSGASALSDGAIATAIGDDGFIRLADVTVANGATSITTGNIADTRTRVQASNASGLGSAVRSPDTPIGAIMPFAGKTAPTNFLICDGSAVSRSTYANLFAVLCPSATFTVTIASPAVFTKVAHGLVAGDRVHFATTGALPTGLTAGTEYYVLSTSLTADVFKVALSPEGTVINTSGTQSGTHTFYNSNYGRGDGSTTFALPDMRSKVATGYGQSGSTTSLVFESGAVDTGAETITVPDNYFPYQGQKVQLTTTGTLPTGLSTSTDYYVIRASATTIKLASSQANANASTPTAINLTGVGSGVHTIVFTNPALTVIGKDAGEDTHAIAVTEMPAHAHPNSVLNNQAGSGGSTGTFGSGNTPTTFPVAVASEGGNARHNVMQPSKALNYIIRY